jgi:putative ABC transport system permease protein
MENWKDDRIASIAVYLPDDMSLEEGRGIVQANLPEGMEFEVFTNNQLRNAVLDVFDNTFAITYALEAVAIMIALLAIGGGMAAIVAERKREFSILRAVGSSRKQLIKRVLVESGLLGISSWIIGSGLGIVLSLILIHVVNKYSFGWSLQLQIQWIQILNAGVLVIIAALVSGTIPALNASKVTIAEGVREFNE